MKAVFWRIAKRVVSLFAVGIVTVVLSVTLATAAEIVQVERLDGSFVKVVIERPEGISDVPVVLFIDGSGCVSVERERFQRYSQLPDEMDAKVAKVFVDKTGVTPQDDGRECSPTFIERDSVDQRVFDHLRVVQYLRKHAKWWNQEILLFGWSDGGTIGASVAAYTPEVQRAVLGGTGGGIPMSVQFEDYVICAPDRTDDRDTCINELRQKYIEIRDNPSRTMTWFGESNTYKAWASRLDVVEYNLIKDIQIPLLIVHGEQDRDSVPVEAARELVRLLDEAGDVDFEYWEVPDMDHGTRSLGEERGNSVRLAMLNWLLELPVGNGGPPQFGRALDE